MKLKLVILLTLCSLTMVYGKRVLLATCDMGSGCTFNLTESSIEEVQIVLSNNVDLSNMSNDDILVNTQKNGEEYWYVEKKRTRSELDRFYGGDGYTMIYPFDPNFQPKDGKWKLEFGEVVGNVCYGQMGNIFKTLSGKLQQGTITFPKPFHPKYAFASSDLKWVKISRNKYRGTFGKDPMSMIFYLELKSKNKIEGKFVVTVKIPTKADCVNTIPVVLNCLEPDYFIDPWEGWSNDPIDLGLGENNPKPNAPRIDDGPKTDVPRIDDGPKTDVPRIEDDPKTHVPRIDDDPHTYVPRIDD